MKGGCRLGTSTRDWCVFFVIFSCSLTSVTKGHNSEEDDAGVPAHRPLSVLERARLGLLWNRYGPDYNQHEQSVTDYPCGPLPKSETVPTSVHKLRPGDIKVIGAMGDSLTAGTCLAAHTILGDLIQYRGLTWSGGGQSNYEDQITVPNILKKYNPELYGYATGNGNEHSSRSHFNVAVSGSTSSDLANQARRLIERMKEDPNVDFENDWKLVTILSGNNDLCDFCRKQDIYNVDNFGANVLEALDILQAELPRTLVNLVEPLNIEILEHLNKGLICAAAHLLVCDCAAYPWGKEAEEKMIYEDDMYQVTVERIAGSGRYDSTEDFTVVAQPFLNQTYIPMREDGQPDMSYFAPDCFHLSRKGQAAAASALWNNMVEPVGEKKVRWTPGEPIECPDEDHPYIYTNRNSQPLQQNPEVHHHHHHHRLHHHHHVPPSLFLANKERELREEESGSSSSSSSSSSIVSPIVGLAVVIAIAAAIILIVVIARRSSKRLTYERI